MKTKKKKKLYTIMGRRASKNAGGGKKAESTTLKGTKKLEGRRGSLMRPGKGNKIAKQPSRIICRFGGREKARGGTTDEFDGGDGNGNANKRERWGFEEHRGQLPRGGETRRAFLTEYTVPKPNKEQRKGAGESKLPKKAH